jgi:glycine/D-amino acid oxidase-like deaminating enzyme
MRAKFDARFPQLAGIAMEYVWAGHLCLSRNGVSVMREIDDGVIYTAAFRTGSGPRGAR